MTSKPNTTAQPDALVSEIEPVDHGDAHATENVERAPTRPDFLHETADEVATRATACLWVRMR